MKSLWQEANMVNGIDVLIGLGLMYGGVYVWERWVDRRKA